MREFTKETSLRLFCVAKIVAIYVFAFTFMDCHAFGMLTTPNARNDGSAVFALLIMGVFALLAVAFLSLAVADFT